MAKKLTTEEIKKALECCTQQHKCNECPYLMEHHLVCNHHLHKDTLDIINRQQTQYETAKSEAIKEFAERLQETLFQEEGYEEKNNNVIRHIDNLVKEMVGEDK